MYTISHSKKRRKRRPPSVIASCSPIASVSVSCRDSDMTMLRSESSSVSSFSLTVPERSRSARLKTVRRYSLNSRGTPNDECSSSASRPDSQRNAAAFDEKYTSIRLRRSRGPWSSRSPHRFRADFPVTRLPRAFAADAVPPASYTAGSGSFAEAPADSASTSSGGTIEIAARSSTRT